MLTSWIEFRMGFQPIVWGSIERAIPSPPCRSRYDLDNMRVEFTDRKGCRKNSLGIFSWFFSCLGSGSVPPPSAICCLLFDFLARAPLWTPTGLLWGSRRIVFVPPCGTFGAFDPALGPLWGYLGPSRHPLESPLDFFGPPLAHFWEILGTHVGTSPKTAYPAPPRTCGLVFF